MNTHIKYSTVVYLNSIFFSSVPIISKYLKKRCPALFFYMNLSQRERTISSRDQGLVSEKRTNHLMEVGGRGQVFGRERYSVHVCESEASLHCVHQEKI